MRRLLPAPPPPSPDASHAAETTEIDVATAVAAEPRPTPPGRPWVMLNMVTSLDGAVVGKDGRSGQLSGPADRHLFRTLRGLADVVLAGAATIRVENYGAPRVPAEVQEARKALGQAPLPLMATVSASLRLDPAARFFRDAAPDQRPIVLTTTRALRASPADRAIGEAHHKPVAIDELAEVADLWECGQATVDWGRALHRLRDEGARVLLVEGGPTVNGQLIFADLVDEFCLTRSPTLVGHPSSGVIAGGRDTTLRRFTLDRVFEEDDFLFLRYLRL